MSPSPVGWPSPLPVLQLPFEQVLRHFGQRLHFSSLQAHPLCELRNEDPFRRGPCALSNSTNTATGGLSEPALISEARGLRGKSGTLFEK